MPLTTRPNVPFGTGGYQIFLLGLSEVEGWQTRFARAKTVQFCFFEFGIKREIGSVCICAAEPMNATSRFPLVRRGDLRLLVADEFHDGGDILDRQIVALELADGVEDVECGTWRIELADHALELIDARPVDTALADDARFDAEKRPVFDGLREVELDGPSLAGIAIEREGRWNGDERSENGDGSQREFSHGILPFASWKSKVATDTATTSVAYCDLVVKVKSWPGI